MKRTRHAGWLLILGDPKRKNVSGRNSGVYHDVTFFSPKQKGIQYKYYCEFKGKQKLENNKNTGYMGNIFGFLGDPIWANLSHHLEEFPRWVGHNDICPDKIHGTGVARSNRW